MFFGAICKLAFKNLLRNPRRSLASFLTVAFGACGLLIYQGFNDGLLYEYREAFIHNHFSFGQVFSINYYDQVKEKPWKYWIENPKIIEEELKKIPFVKEVFPRLTFYAFLQKLSIPSESSNETKKNVGISLGGISEGILPERERLFFTKLVFTEGRLLMNENEISLGLGLAKSLNVKVGDFVTVMNQTIYGQLNGVDLKVVGILQTGLKSIDEVYFKIHLNQAQKLLETNRIESFALDTSEMDDWSSVASAIQKNLPSLEAIPFEEIDKTFYQNSINFLHAQFSFIRIIVLFIVAIGIFNTISVGLFERSAEIGAFRANGESRLRLIKILSLESAMIGFLGGCFGILLAFLLNKTLLKQGVPVPPGPGVTSIGLIPLKIYFLPMLNAIVFPTLTTIASSLWPVWKIMKRSIPDLLRS